jgi:hypothetical protein
MSDNPFLPFLKKYRNDPVGFVRNVLNLEPQEWQKQFLQHVADPAKRQVAVKAGHGVGKSSATAWACAWHMVCRYPQKAVITAPTSAQLFDALFAELKATILRLPPALQELFNVTSDRISLKAAPDESFISARTARAESPEALQGVHSKHVLLIADEASGVPEAVFEAGLGSMSGEHATTILLGNPTRSAGFFFNAFNSGDPRWTLMTVSCMDSPLVSPDFVEQIRSTYGDNSNAFRVRVLGLFPRADDDTVIPLYMVEDAQKRDIEVAPNEPEVWGLDVARFGDDRSVLVKRKGKVVPTPPTVWKNKDLMQLSGLVKAEYDTAAQKPVEILIDSIGLGSGVVDRLRELNLPARGINVSESPAMKNGYVNLRAELWFKTKAWFESLQVKIPKESNYGVGDSLTADLCAVKYDVKDSNGRIQIESKADMKKRLRRSSDLADALCLTFASDAATAAFGGSYNSGWNKPLKRNIRGII